MDTKIKNRTLRRLRIIGGQIRGLQRMVESEQYCIDIITQSRAIKEALAGVEDLILENHLATHAIEQIKSGRAAKAIKEILMVSQVSKKK